MRYLPITEYEFLDECIELINDPEVKDGKNTIQNLLDTTEKWLLRFVIGYQHSY